MGGYAEQADDSEPGSLNVQQQSLVVCLTAVMSCVPRIIVAVREAIDTQETRMTSTREKFKFLGARPGQL